MQHPSETNNTLCRCIKSSSKKAIVHFINREHANKTHISRRKLRKNSLPNCNVFINENLTIKNNKIAFLGRKRKCSGHLNEIYPRDGKVHFSSPEIYKGSILKIHHINDLSNLLPYHDFEENYREMICYSLQ